MAGDTRYAKRESDILSQRGQRLEERLEGVANTAIELYNRIEQVEQLHRAVKIGTSGMAYCGHCSDYNAGNTVMHPCPTLQILTA